MSNNHNDPLRQTLEDLQRERAAEGRVDPPAGLKEALARVPETLRDFLTRKLGTRNWVVAPRMTDGLRGRGYEVAISHKRYKDLEREWEVARYGAPLASLREAAPDMLAAAEWMLALIDGREPMPHPTDDVAHELRAAIAKARGKA